MLFVLMDLLSILPDFPIKSYEHLLPLLEGNNISTTDLLTLDTIEIAKRTRVPLTDARQFTEQVIKALHQDVGFEQKSAGRDEQEDGANEDITSNVDPTEQSPFGKLDVSEWSSISTLDPILDDVLRGGIPTSYVTELTGERFTHMNKVPVPCVKPDILTQSPISSATGKSQFLLHLLLSVQLPPPVGLSRRALYISTESPLPTNRLQQLLESHPAFVTIPPDITPPSLDNVMSLNAIDLETQDHVIKYQLPVAVSSYDIGLVVIDSVTWNYRGEYSLNLDGMATRAGELVNLGRILRDLAVKEDVAVVVANQVLDRFDDKDDDFYVDHLIHLLPDQNNSSSKSPHINERAETTSNSPHTSLTLLQSATPSTPPLPGEPPSSTPSTRPNLLSLSHQQRFFTGWGDRPPDSALRTDDISGGLKTPALGLLWSSQIACRIVLKKSAALLPAPLSATTCQRPTPDNQSLQPSTLPRNASGPREGDEPNEQAHNAKSNTTLPDGIVPQDGNKVFQETSNDEFPGTQSEYGEYEPSREPTVRTMKVVFAPWTSGRRNNGASREGEGDPESGREVQFKIWESGIHALK